MSKVKKSHIITAFKGFAIGTADIIPGVSGGTVAFLTGVYKPLINATASFGVDEIKAILGLIFSFFNKEKRQQNLSVLLKMDWELLLPLLIGLVCAIASMARIMPPLLENYPFIMYSLFFGLILFSVSIPYREMNHGYKEFATIAAFAAIAMLALGEPSGEPGSTHPLYLFLCGAIAICSMILPGISGSYVLILLGEYKIVLTAVRSHDLSIVLPFLLGIFVGITTFTRVLKYCLAKYYSLTMAALTGFLIGSLKVLWPGQHSADFLKSAPETATGFGLIVFGALILWGLEKVSDLAQKEMPSH